MADSKRFLPLPPYLRLLLDVPSVANAEIGSQTTIMAMGNKDKDKKKVVEKQESGNSNQEPPDDDDGKFSSLVDFLDWMDSLRQKSKKEGFDFDKETKTIEPRTNLPYGTLSEMERVAREQNMWNEIEKVVEETTQEKPKPVEIEEELEVEVKKPYTVSYNVDGKPITDVDLANEVSKLSTAELNKQRREYFNAFNSPTSWASPQRWKTALANVKEMPQDLTIRDLISKKWNSKLDINTRRMHLAHARLDAINKELAKREDYDPSTLEQGSFEDILVESSENMKKLKDAMEQLEYYKSRGIDDEAKKLEKSIAEFKKKNNI